MSEDRVREIVGEALAVALPVAVRFIEHRLAHGLVDAGIRPLFHGWSDRP